MEIYKKIQQARESIKASNLKKSGKNTYSNYDYYTPEQVNKLVWDACKAVNLFNKFSLVRSDLGLMAELQIIDLDSTETAEFKIATEIPEIKATNIAQQLGGAVTYSERYLLMIAYDIKDNNLDFDSHKPKEEKAEKPTDKNEDNRPWLDDKSYNSVLAKLQEPKPTMLGSLTFKDNQEIYNYVDKKYKMKKQYREMIKSLIGNEVESHFSNLFAK